MLQVILNRLIRIFGRQTLEKWIPLDRLCVTSLTDPEIHLANVPLPDVLFESISVPFSLVKSNISRVVVKCPWTSFFKNFAKDSLKIDVEGVEIVVRTKHLCEFQDELARSSFERKKLKDLAKAAKPSKKKIAKVVNALCVTVRDVKLTLVDDVLHSEPFSIVIRADVVELSGMDPGDPVLEPNQRRGILDSLLIALLVRSRGVQMWHLVYKDGEEELDAESSMDSWGTIESKQTSRTSPEIDECGTWMDQEGKAEPVSEEELSNYSHSSDEMFESDDEGAANILNVKRSAFCLGCSGIDVADVTIEHEVKDANLRYLSILKLPYTVYKVTPSAGITFTLMFKQWDVSALALQKDSGKDVLRSMDIGICADSDKLGRGTNYGYLFDGRIRYEPFAVTMTTAGMEVLYNFIKHIQLVSFYRALLLENFNAMPSIHDCRKYVNVLGKPQILHAMDSDFIEKFEKATPIPIVVQLRNISKSFGKTGNLLQDMCSLCDGNANHFGNQSWFRGERGLTVTIPNVQLEMISASQLHEYIEGVTVDKKHLPCVIFHTDILRVVSESKINKCSRTRIMISKPVLRYAKIRALAERRSFSAKVSFRHVLDDRLLVYPDALFDANDDEKDMELTFEGYGNAVKATYLQMPKMNLVINTLYHFYSTVGPDAFKDIEKGYINLDVLYERTERLGVGNAEIMDKIREGLRRPIRSIFKGSFKDISLRLYISTVTGTSKPVIDRDAEMIYLENDALLSQWDYCKDIAEPLCEDVNDPFTIISIDAIPYKVDSMVIRNSAELETIISTSIKMSPADLVEVWYKNTRDLDFIFEGFDGEIRDVLLIKTSGFEILKDGGRYLHLAMGDVNAALSSSDDFVEAEDLEIASVKEIKFAQEVKTFSLQIEHVHLSFMHQLVDAMLKSGILLMRADLIKVIDRLKDFGCVGDSVYARGHGHVQDAMESECNEGIIKMMQNYTLDVDALKGSVLTSWPKVVDDAEKFLIKVVDTRLDLENFRASIKNIHGEFGMSPKSVKLKIGGTTLVKDKTHVLIACCIDDLVHCRITENEVKDGQVFIEYIEDGSQQVANVKVEIQNFHHRIDADFIDECKQIAECIDMKSGGGKRNLSLRISLYNSSLHYFGVGIKLELYAMLSCFQRAKSLDLSLKIPRMHVLTCVNFEDLLSFSLINLAFKMVPKDNVERAHFSISHCALWGFYDVYGQNEVERMNGQEAVNVLLTLLQEDWYSQLIRAMIPSSELCFGAKNQKALVPIFVSKVPMGVRLAPLLNAKWIKEWLDDVSTEPEPDVFVANVLKHFNQSLDSRDCDFLSANFKISRIDECKIITGSASLSNCSILLHLEPIMSLVEELKRLDFSALQSRDKGGPAIVTISVGVDMDVSFPITLDSATRILMPLEMLPSVSAHNEKEIRNENIRILCKSTIPRTFSRICFNVESRCQKVQGLHMLPDDLVGVDKEDLAILAAAEEQRYAFLDYFDEIKMVTFLHCENLTTVLYRIPAGFTTRSMDDGSAMQIVSIQSPLGSGILEPSKDSYNLCAISLQNIVLDSCCTPSRDTHLNFSLESIKVVDSVGKFLIRSIPDNASHKLKAQVSATLTRRGNAIAIKCNIEKTRTEIQPEGLEPFFEVLKDIKRVGKGSKELSRNDSALDVPTSTTTKDVLIRLNLYEIWIHPSASTDTECIEKARSYKFLQYKRPSKQYIEPDTIPVILKTAHRIENPCMDAEDDNVLNILGIMSSITFQICDQRREVEMKYLGICMGHAKNIGDDVTMLADEKGDLFHMDTLGPSTMDRSEFGPRMLLETHAGMLNIDEEADKVNISSQLNKIKVHLTVDNIFHFMNLKPLLFDPYARLVNMLIQTRRRNEPDAASQMHCSDSLFEDIRHLFSKHGMELETMCNVQYNDYVSVNHNSVKFTESVLSLIGPINHLFWKKGDKEITVSFKSQDSHFTLVSGINDLVISLNLHEAKLQAIHGAPSGISHTILDSSLLFNISLMSSSLEDTMLRNTLVTAQILRKGGLIDRPSLVTNLCISGIVLELNSRIIQLFQYVSSISSILSGKCDPSISINLYNALGIEICVLSGISSNIYDKVLTMPPGTVTSVPDRELLIFLKRSSVDAIDGAGREWIMEEYKNLLFGNSNNVKNLLGLFNNSGDIHGTNYGIPSLPKGWDQLDTFLFLGKYENAPRLLKFPNTGYVILVEPSIDPFTSQINVTVSSSISIQNSTSLNFIISQDPKVGYLKKLAYKITKKNEPSQQYQSLYINAYTSANIPISWFGNGIMPMIAPMFPNQFENTNEIPFPQLHLLLNKHRFVESELESQSLFALKFRGYLGFKCSLAYSEISHEDDHAIVYYKFVITIEPMIKIINSLPFNVVLYVSLSKNIMAQEEDSDDIYQLMTSYRAVKKLSSREAWGIPFSEQRIFLRVAIQGAPLRSMSDAFYPLCTFISNTFSLNLPSFGRTSTVKPLKFLAGQFEALEKPFIPVMDAVTEFFKNKEYFQYMKRIQATFEVSRNSITIIWPFSFENITNSFIALNGYIIPPGFKLHGNLQDATNSRIRAFINTSESLFLHTNQSGRLDLTSTTTLRSPIYLNVPIEILKRYAFSNSSIQGPLDIEPILENIKDKIQYKSRIANPKRISMDDVNVENTQIGAVASNFNSTNLTLGCTVRYSSFPYNTCKIVVISNLFTFVNKLPFSICIRGVTADGGIEEFGNDNELEGISNCLVITPGETCELNTPCTHACVIKLENGNYSSKFPLIPPRVPTNFQLELNSENVAYTTMASRGILIQVNVISGKFAESKLPYTYNGYYFVLSIPNTSHYQVLNITRYTLAYTVPENVKTMEAKMVEEHSQVQFGGKADYKIGILPPNCITHYVPSTYKITQQHEIALKVLNSGSDWTIHPFSIHTASVSGLCFLLDEMNREIYTATILRHDGSRILVIVESRDVAAEIKACKGAIMRNEIQTPWSSITINVKTPRITLTLKRKRRVIIAAHFTNLAVSFCQRIFGTSDSEEGSTGALSTIHLNLMIKAIHIDHFLHGFIPVILKSLAKRHSKQESFLECKLAGSIYSRDTPLVVDSANIKTSPLSINIEMRVIEQIVDYLEMVKLQINTDETARESLVRPEPKWSEMKATHPVYILDFCIEPINLVLAIRTSDVKLSRQTLQLLDALPLDTPSVCVHFASEKRSYSVFSLGELAHSLKHSYLRQLIRQSLPTAWLSNSFAVIYGVGKGLIFLVTQPFTCAKQFGGIVPSMEGFVFGIGNGVKFLVLYIVGGIAQSMGHVLNVLQKILGRKRARPLGILDALWLGINGVLLDIFVRPWKKIVIDFKRGKGNRETRGKICLKLATNLVQCILCPVFAAVNMLITVAEGLSNVLLGDLEQFTHIYESDQLEKPQASGVNFGISNFDSGSKEDGTRESNTFIKRMKTATMRKFY
ncbi:hypothetical protein BEWA_027410 [Theileria equi strain WA]|uniref:Uncharacterized protein n=1 Tax=Theileria equi strain WA TaxID=1537102 RepID=L0AWE5_THEEQ|nr:hypothetical protein BEWA_027410 [Theileria equi strain WA]AFZ79892.1 hypothetical protein BEWA_027410 [Theileria equi strain WA]|eukprot:XP_004829558.1 hypothetical protein BEWA_027410 [Theileria equi strain WA]